MYACVFTYYIYQPMEVYVDDDSKLTLHGLQQHYVKLRDNEKNRKLFDLLDALEFNQVLLLCLAIGYASITCVVIQYQVCKYCSCMN